MLIIISTRDAVIQVLYHIQVTHNVTYSQVKRSTIKSLLWRFHKIDRCLSTIDYHLGEIKKAGFMKVYTRRGQDEKGRWFNKASNRQLLGKCFNYLIRSGRKVARFLTDWAFKGIKHKRHKFKTDSPIDGIFKDQPPRRSAAPFETLEKALSDTLKTLS